MADMSDSFKEWWAKYRYPISRSSSNSGLIKQVAEDTWTAAMQSVFNPRFKEGQKVGEHTIARRWSVNGQWFYRVDGDLGSDWSQDELINYQRVQPRAY